MATEKQSPKNPGVDDLLAEQVAHPSWVCVSSCECVEGVWGHAWECARPPPALGATARSPDAADAGGRQMRPRCLAEWPPAAFWAFTLGHPAPDCPGAPTSVSRKMQVGGCPPRAGGCRARRASRPGSHESRHSHSGKCRADTLLRPLHPHYLPQRDGSRCTGGCEGTAAPALRTAPPFVLWVRMSLSGRSHKHLLVNP